jgi:hypothetical protein
MNQMRLWELKNGCSIELKNNYVQNCCRHTKIYKGKKMPNSCDLGITNHLQIGITSIMHYGKTIDN